MPAGARTVHHAQKGSPMYSLHTDIYDLGTLMSQVIDRLAAEMDGAVTQSAEMVPRESDEEANFDYYAYACTMLDCR